MRSFVSILILFVSTVALGEGYSLDPAKYKHITFEDIPQTKYSAAGAAMRMEVKKSSSFMLQPFSAKKKVSRLKFMWKSTGNLQVKSAEQEKEKDGDDSRLRIGLVLAGDAPTVPFFAPAWIKAIRDTMKLPSDKMVYLTMGAKNKPGTVWESPYSDSMELRALASKPEKDGWNAVDHKLAKPLDVVALWIMADGDNTESSFVTELKDLNIE